MWNLAFGSVASVLASMTAGQASITEPSYYVICWSNHYTSSAFSDSTFALRLLNEVQRTSLTEREARVHWRAFVQKEVPSLVLGSAICDDYRDYDGAARRRSKLLNRPSRSVRFEFPEPAEVAGPSNGSATEQQAQADGSKRLEDGADTSEAETRAAARATREAEFQAKLAAHKASVADYERKVAAREAEIARQQREHAAAQDAAAREKASHARLIEEHMKRQMDYDAARNRHTLCVNGNQQACDEIAAGKPATSDKLADAGEASTDTDANRCVTTAEVRTNATFQGNTSASVMNGCGQKVDVRICLMRTGGWNCGTVWGVDPQGRATHSSFHATGEVFVDARVAGSNRALASP